MTASDLDLAVALLALKRGRVAADAWGRIAEAWSGDPAARLGERLVAEGLLSPPEREALEADVLQAEAASTHRASRSPRSRVPAGPGAEIVAERPDARFRLEGPGQVTEPGVREVVALDESLGRRVLLRLVRPDAPAGVRERILGEASLLARLEHPGILPVHDTGLLTATREDYVSLRLVDGRSLEETLAKRSLDLRRGIEVVRDVARALAFAHAHGVEHGGVTAGKVMVGPRGEALLVGWEHAAEISSGQGAADVAALRVLLGSAVLAAGGRDPVLADLARPESHARTAAAIAAELDRTLEGEREKDRRRQAADESVRRAVEGLASRQSLLMDAETASDSAREALRGVQSWEPVARKVGGWRLEDEAAATRARAAESLADAEGALHAAVESVTDHVEARRMLASLAFEKFLEAEAAGNDAQAILHARRVAEFDDGGLAARRRGDGRISVATVAYRCDCLKEGRLVEPGELLCGGRHLVSGRRVGNAAVPCVAELEPAEPIRRRVHGPACRAVPVAGADVWAFRFEEVNRLLVPSTPVPSNRPIPEDLLDRMYGNSPYRPHGGGIWLGKTPVEPRPWPMGSWLLLVAREGSAPVRVPVRMRREEDCVLEVTLFGPQEIPPGSVQVAAGWCELGGNGVDARLNRRTWLDDAFVATRPATLAEHCRGASVLSRRGDAGLPIPRIQRAPEWSRDGAGNWIPAAGVDPELPGRMYGWADAVSHAWAESDRLGWLFSLPDIDLREKCARGADGRIFPWGRRGDPAFAVVRESFRGDPGMQRSGSRPADASVYGIFDLAGNTLEWCLDDCAPLNPDWKMVRGNSFLGRMKSSRSYVGLMFLHSMSVDGIGVRLSAPVRLPPRASPGDP